MLIDEGSTYFARAIFDPQNNISTLELENLTDPATDFADRSTSGTKLVNSDAPTIIGGAFDAGTANRFNGYIDDLRISVIPEPAMAAVLIPVLCLIAILYRRRSVMRK